MWWFNFAVLIIISVLVAAKMKTDFERGLIGAGIALFSLFVLQLLLYFKAREEKKGKLKFFDLIVTSEDNRYSLTRFQIYIWTVWLVVAFTQAAFATSSFPTLHPNLAILMGINGFTTALSTAITDLKKAEETESVKNANFFRDIFLDKKCTLDLARTQMFIWTVVILAAHMVMYWKQYLYGDLSKFIIPDIPEGLLILMGVSNGAYLGVKKATEK